MPQLIIHSEIDGRARVKAEMVESLRTCMVHALELPEEHGQVMLYETLPINRAMSESRKGLVFVEIKMIEGRPKNMKSKFADEIIAIISKDLEIPKNNVLCLINEYSRDAYVTGK